MQFETDGDPAAQAATWAIVAIGMESFAAKLISHMLAVGSLDDWACPSIKGQVIAELEDTESFGLPIELEAIAIREAINHVNQLIDSAFEKGRKYSGS